MSVQSLPAIALLGPTASGKSALGLAMANAGLPIEIISLDSALVFKGMDIGTAKPSRDELALVPHHLIDLIEPTQVYNASDFISDCLQLIDAIRERGCVPVILGGTMMYYNGLTQGIDDMPDRSPTIRADIEYQARQQGWPALHAELMKVDPVTAQRLKPNDSQRIERALEVYRVSGQPISQFQKRVGPVRQLPTLTLLPSDRGQLHRRIELRFDQMLEQGLADELQGLKAKYPDLDRTMPSMRCVGYRQMWEYLEKEVPFDTMRDKGIAATRQLAKRQITWLRSIPGQTQVDPLQPDWEQGAMQWLTDQVTSLLPKK